MMMLTRSLYVIAFIHVEQNVLDVDQNLHENLIVTEFIYMVVGNISKLLIHTTLGTFISTDRKKN
jgi:hypothetical protein